MKDLKEKTVKNLFPSLIPSSLGFKVYNLDKGILDWKVLGKETVKNLFPSLIPSSPGYPYPDYTP